MDCQKKIKVLIDWFPDRRCVRRYTQFTPSGPCPFSVQSLGLVDGVVVLSLLQLCHIEAEVLAERGNVTIAFFRLQGFPFLVNLFTPSLTLVEVGEVVS